jgi:hypothetical protein
MSQVERKKYQEHIGLDNSRGKLTMDEWDVDGNNVRVYTSKRSRRVVAFTINHQEFYTGA